jgi:hypothetical protein
MRIKKLLMSNKIATMDELKRVLETGSTMTVFRKLRAAGYLSSYSHRGKYYTIGSIPKFDQSGLWSCNSVRFSKYGGLIETARKFIDNSTAGLTAKELEKILHVEVRHALLHLFKTDHVYREKVSGTYVYAACESSRQKLQMAMRKNGESVDLSEELRAALILFFSSLDEKQRRSYAGLEALKLGHGGDKKISQLLGMDAHTVAKGRKELCADNMEKQRVRKKGGGRKPVKKKLRR